MEDESEIGYIDKEEQYENDFKEKIKPIDAMARRCKELQMTREEYNTYLLYKIMRKLEVIIKKIEQYEER